MNAHLVKEAARKFAEYQKIRQQLEAEKDKKYAEEIKPLVGKYFKFHNSYGRGSEWYEYLEVLRTDGTTIHYQKYLKDSNGNIKVETDESNSWNDHKNYWQKIDKAEFLGAKGAVLKALRLKAEGA